jgi:hypothetical protein
MLSRKKPRPESNSKNDPNDPNDPLSRGASTVKKTMLVCGLILLSSTGWAAATSCDEVKATIDKKLEGKGVKNYSLEVLAKDAETTNRVVGSCDGGKSKIIYQRTSGKKSAE